MSRQSHGATAAPQALARTDVAHLVLDAEDDMRKVQDLALIVHDHMTSGRAITPEMQNALSWLTGELLEIGERLNDRFDTLYAAAHGRH